MTYDNLPDSPGWQINRVGQGLLIEGDPAVEELRFVRDDELGVYLPSPSLGDSLRWYVEQTNEVARYWFFPEYTAE